MAADAIALTADEGRRIALAAQGLLGAPGREERRAGAAGVLRRLGAVQLDTISVLARSHELVAYARLGPIGRAAVERAYWGGGAFEYWAHAASILPMEDWPWFTARRLRYRDDALWRREAPREAIALVRKRLAEDGPLTATELGGAKGGGPWWDWTPLKIAVERLLSWGEVVCIERRGWKRVYDLAERAVPSHLLSMTPSEEECRTELVRRAGVHLGVATLRDLADYYRLKTAWAAEVVDGTDLVPVHVAGWREPAWADPARLEELSEGRLRGRHRTTLLSPFDSLIWDRTRTERIFRFSHRLEAYVPKDKREHGYFVMPLLAGGQLVGRVDPKRAGRTLVAQQVTLARRSAVPAMATALVEAATWVGCDNVAVETVRPADFTAPLRSALATPGL